MSDDLIQLPVLPCPEEDPSWRARARCLGSDTKAFYPDKGGNVASAKLICFGCPVRKQCADFALANNIHYGVFGGLTEKDRKKVRNGQRTTDITFQEVLQYSFFSVNNTYPRANDKDWYRYSEQVLKTASESLMLPVKTIRENIPNARDLVI
jgi:hypothetical protein